MKTLETPVSPITMNNSPLVVERHEPHERVSSSRNSKLKAKRLCRDDENGEKSRKRRRITPDTPDNRRSKSNNLPMEQFINGFKCSIIPSIENGSSRVNGKKVIAEGILNLRNALTSFYALMKVRQPDAHLPSAGNNTVVLDEENAVKALEFLRRRDLNAKLPEFEENRHWSRAVSKHKHGGKTQQDRRTTSHHALWDTVRKGPVPTELDHEYSYWAAHDAALEINRLIKALTE
jgi:hypothetical protein